ncbi:hypothetical protein N7454_008065 [Penicillium verhagenii]|nr:hypothetical protein N7454_008065 [Penicillium verhagenii]
MDTMAEVTAYAILRIVTSAMNPELIIKCMKICSAPIDTPKKEGETDASYYQRMDKLHWH